MAPTSKAFVTVLLLSLALCQITAAEPSLEGDGGPFAHQIINGIKEIATASDKLRKGTETLNENNAGVKGNLIPHGFHEIGTKVADVTRIIKTSRLPPLSDKDDKLVVEALTKFVEGHWKPLIHVVQGKHKVHALHKFFKEIVESLRKLEYEFKYFETALLKVLQTQKEAAKKQFHTIDELIKKTIQLYEKKIPLTPHGDSPVEAIQEALTTFLQAQQELLNVLIGKDGITTYAGDLA